MYVSSSSIAGGIYFGDNHASEGCGIGSDVRFGLVVADEWKVVDASGR